MMKEKIKALIPSYYNEFQCIGGACEDTCCAGWTLPVDKKSFDKYKKVKNQNLRRRLDKELVRRKNGDDENFAKIKLKNNRCAFLTKDDWCELYKELGESYLSHSCRIYPRTMNNVEGVIEYSLTASCPEATRKILLLEEGIKFESHMIDSSDMIVCATLSLHKHKSSLAQAFYQIRVALIAELQNRNLEFEQRLKVLESKCHQMSDLLNTKQNTVSNEVKLFETSEMLRLGECVKEIFVKTKCRIPRYTQCLEEMLEGLRIGEQEAKSIYEDSEKTYYRPFVKNYDYMLENYFVNYIYERCMPLDGESLEKSCKRMLLYYKLIKLHLIGMATYKKSLSKEDVILCIQSFTKVYDHGALYIKEIEEQL